MTERPTTASVGQHGHAPPLRALQPRPLRRQPRRRRLLAGRLRRRRDRDVHPHRRRRGAVRVVLRRPVQGAGPRRRRHRDRGRARPGRHAAAARWTSRCGSSAAARPDARRVRGRGRSTRRSSPRPPGASSSSPDRRRPDGTEYGEPRAAPPPVPHRRRPASAWRSRPSTSGSPPRSRSPCGRGPGPVPALGRGFLLGLAGGLVFFVPTLSWSGIYVGSLPWIALATPGGPLPRRGRRALRLAEPPGECPTARVRARVGRDGGPARPRALWRLPVAQAGLRPGGLALRAPRRPRRGALRRLRHRAERGPARARGPARSDGDRRAPGERRRRRRLRAYAVGSTGAPRGRALVLGVAGLAVPLPTDGPTAQFLGVQGNVARPGSTSTPSAGRSSTTTSRRPSRPRRTSTPVGHPPRTSSSGPRTPPTSTPCATPTPRPSSSRPSTRCGARSSSAACSRSPPASSSNVVAALRAGQGQHRPLRQAAPGAVRRVHPQPAVLADLQQGGRPRQRGTSSRARRPASSA